LLQAVATTTTISSSSSSSALVQDVAENVKWVSCDAYGPDGALLLQLQQGRQRLINNLQQQQQ
jgi:hypothetical protein